MTQTFPNFNIIQAQLQRHQFDCYKIANTQYHFCTHRPSSSRCLIRWHQSQWIVSGKTNLPAYQIAAIVLNKLANCREATDEKASQPPVLESAP